MVLARGFYMTASKMIPRTWVRVDVPGLRVDAFGTISSSNHSC